MRWLTFDQLVTELQIPIRAARKLLMSGKLAAVCTGNPRRVENWRIPDPAEQIKEVIRNQETLLAGTYDFDAYQFPLISAREFSQLAKIAPATVRVLIFKKIIHPLKIRNLTYFTPDEVRRYLLRREQKEMRHRRARCQFILEWCLRLLENTETMSKEEVNLDDHLEGLLRRLMRLKEPERTRAVAEFWRRYQLSKDVVTAIRGVQMSANHNGCSPLQESKTGS